MCSLKFCTLVALLGLVVCDEQSIKYMRTYIGNSVTTAGYKHVDDNYLQKFLDARDNKPFDAFELLQNYVRMRKSHPEAFITATKAMKEVIPPLFFVTNDTTPTGQRIVYGKPSNWDFTRDSLSDAAAQLLPFLEYEVDQPNSPGRTNGYAMILDMREWNLFHTAFVRASSMRTIIEMTERALPVRIRTVHVVYETRLSDALLPLSRPFMSNELRESFVYHGTDMSTLYAAIPARYLPTVIGGEKALPQFSEQQLKEVDARLKQIWSVI